LKVGDLVKLKNPTAFDPKRACLITEKTWVNNPVGEKNWIKILRHQKGHWVPATDYEVVSEGIESYL
jgi:hypothetical protein